MSESIINQIDTIVSGKLAKQEIEQLGRLFKKVVSNSLDGNDDSTKDDGFYKDITSEFSSDVKDLASVLIDFRKELELKLTPHINDIATKDIPNAADQLEAVIETTETAANQVMDNLDSMELKITEIKKPLASLRQGLISDPGLQINNDPQKHKETDKIDENTLKTLLPVLDQMDSSCTQAMALISDTFVQMSFQDLTGQRIKRTIKLVSDIEDKLKNMIISFGIKLHEKEQNPGVSSDDLQNMVDEKIQELAGPQREGEGLDQSGIDDLLANL